MQEHPVPQNVTSFEFKLIGDMTLHQFGYVGTGLGMALIAFFLPIKSGLFLYLIRFPGIFIPPIIGFALAFVPIEGRPLDRWFVSFLRAVFGNTLYVWKKQGAEIAVLHNLPMHEIPDPSQQTIPTQTPMATRIDGRPKPLSPLDAFEQQSMQRLTQVSNSAIPVPRSLAGPLAPAPMQRPIVPHMTKLTAYAGSPQPTNRMAAQRAAPLPNPAFPQVMRQPFQRPLAPKRIPLPSYQQATLNHQAPTPIHFTQPTRPMQVMPSDGQLAQLRAQNQALFNRLQRLEAAISAGTVATQDVQLIKQDDKMIHDQLSGVQGLVSKYQKQLISLADDETKYQTLLTDLTEKLAKTQEEKKTLEETTQKLTQDNIQKQDLIAQDEAKNSDLSAKMSDLQAQLAQTKALLADLQQQKQTAATLLTPLPVPDIPTPPLSTESAMPMPTIEHLPVPQLAPDLSKISTEALEKTARLNEQAEKTVVGPPPPKTLPIEHQDTPKPEPVAVPASTVQQQNLPALTNIPNTISGYIFDIKNKPLLDVIAVVKKANGPTMRALKTNRVGQFSMVSPLPEGKYEVLFEKDGYTFPTIQVEAKGEVIPAMSIQGKQHE